MFKYHVNFRRKSNKTYIEITKSEILTKMVGKNGKQFKQRFSYKNKI